MLNELKGSEGEHTMTEWLQRTLHPLIAKPFLLTHTKSGNVQKDICSEQGIDNYLHWMVTKSCDMDILPFHN